MLLDTSTISRMLLFELILLDFGNDWLLALALVQKSDRSPLILLAGHQLLISVLKHHLVSVC